jgi:DNA-binding SARP family transcriptional activator/Flp pilus assembly protein TadD
MIQLRILGPLEVVARDQPVPLRSRRLRTVVAVLAAHANRTATVDELIAGLWADRAPDTAVGQLHTLVWRLRHWFGDALLTRPGGYQLTLAPGELDAEVFATRAAEAARLAAAGHAAGAAGRYAEALALWRGPVLADVDVPGDAHACGLLAAVAELNEQRLTVERDHVDVELSLGRHADLVPRLHRRVRAEPLHEELRERLMLALHRCGRRAEALRVYREGRDVLVGQLGLEPGAGLRRLHARILADDPTLDAPAGPAPAEASAPVWQLPPDVADFVARDEQVTAIVDALTDPDRPAGTPRVVTVSGVAGAGKTALAVHAGHRVRGSFPDGALFADLRGGATALDPGEVLARFLRALGEDPRRVPADTDERAAAFRARTQGRRLLVVLDNVADETQVRPLLPAEPRCAVLVTGRRRLTALPGAHQVDLGVFTTGQATDLMRRALGADRVAAQADDCALIVHRCGHLPLAIRIAAARLAARPHWPLRRLADQLADARARLDVLRTGDLAVRSSLALSHQALTGPERRAFRLLGALDLPDVAAWALAPLLAVPLDAAEELVERLVEARLLEAVPVGPATGTGTPPPVRYRMHDLVHAYARELAATEPAADLAAALGRLFGAWLLLADTAEARLPSGFRRGPAGPAPRWDGWTPEQVEAVLGDPLTWFEAERPALVAAVRQAAGAGLAATAWDLAGALAGFFELREHLDDWRITHEAALHCCVAAGDRRGEAYLRRGLGELHLDLDRVAEGVEHLRAALTLMRRRADRHGEALVLRALGTAHRLGGADATATDVLTEALRISEQLDDTVGRAQVLHNLGVLHRRAGRPEQAEQAHRQALALFGALGDRFGEAYVRCSLGIVVGLRPDRTADAERELTRSVALCREVGYRRGEAIALGHLGELHTRTGAYESALVELRDAVTGCHAVGDGPGEAIGLRRLGELHLRMGNHAAARSALRRALAVGRPFDLTAERARALRGLGELAATRFPAGGVPATPLLAGPDGGGPDDGESAVRGPSDAVPAG